MSPAKSLQTLLREDLDELRALRDEARLELHLAGMDARSAFDELEGRLEEFEGRLLHVRRAAAVNAVLRLGNDLKKGFERFKHEIVDAPSSTIDRVA